MAPTSFSSPVAAGTPITQGFHAGHPGVDFGVPVGTGVSATADGAVIFAGNDDPNGYGNHVDIDHGDGWTSRYAHLSAFAVAPGTKVAGGDVFAASGGAAGAPGAGNSTGPHLHFEIRQSGVPMDPTLYITGTPTGRLTNLVTPGVPVVPLAPGGAGDAASAAWKAIEGPITQLVGQLPADTLKIMLGGHSVTELAIRSVELYAGAILLMVGGFMVLRLIASGGEAGRTVASAGAAGRTVKRGGANLARVAGVKKPPARRPPARTSSTTRRTSSTPRTSSDRSRSTRTNPNPSPHSRPPRRGAPRAPEHYGAGDVELVR